MWQYPTATPFTMPCSLIVTSPLLQSQGTLATAKTRCWSLMTTSCLLCWGHWEAELGGNSEGGEWPSWKITEGEKEPCVWQRSYLYMHGNGFSVQRWFRRNAVLFKMRWSFWKKNIFQLVFLLGYLLKANCLCIHKPFLVPALRSKVTLGNPFHSQPASSL